MKLNRKTANGGGTSKFLTCLLTLVLVVSTIPILPSTAQGEGQEGQTTVQTQDNASLQEQVSGETTTKVEPATDVADSQEQQTQDSSSADTQQEEAQSQSEDADSAQTEAHDTQNIQAEQTYTTNEALLADDYIASTTSCKIVRGDTTTYFDTLTEAIADLQDGDTIEIFKSHTIKEASTISVSNVTIKNITNPTDDRDNPTQNQSADAQPVVNFEAGAQITFTQTANLTGVIFDGNSKDRTTPAIVATSGTLTISNGEANEDKGIEATTCTLRSFASTTSLGGAILTSGAEVKMTSGEISGNSALKGGAVYIESGSFSISDGIISGNNATDGAAAYNAGGKVAVTGGEISGNTATSKAGAIYVGNAVVTSADFTGGLVTNNTSGSGGAVYVPDTNNCSATLIIRNNAKVIGNTAGGKDANIEPNTTTNIQIMTGITSSARIGIYSSKTICNANSQFTWTNTTAGTFKNLNVFSNDVNPACYATQTTTSSNITWGTGATCKITHATGLTDYYATLNLAVAAASAGETVEIFKSHTVAAAMAPTVALTIKNVDTPLSSSEDWTKNGNATAPVVTFAAAARLTVNTNITLQGVQFDGGGAAATPITRENSGILVNAVDGVKLTVNTGAEVDETVGRTLKTDTKFTNFINYMTPADGTDSGGAFNIAGTAELNDVTVSGCVSSPAGGATGGWVGGGAVAFVTGTLTINRGLYTKNGNSPTTSKGGHWNNSPFTVESGSIYATDASFTENTGNCGGVFVTTKNKAGGLISISGGTISDNYASYGGGGIFLGEVDPGSTCIITGDTQITGNSTGGYNDSPVNAEACEGSAIYVRGSCSLELSGTVSITGNNVTGKHSQAVAVFVDSTYTGADGNVKFTGGSPVIYDNMNGANQANLGSYDATTAVQVTGSLTSPKIGYRTTNAAMDGEGEQFAIASTTPATNTTGIAGAFINDIDSSLVSIPNSTTNAITWGKAVVKEVTSDATGNTFVAYYDSLNAAITSATSGNVLEIMRTHALTGNATTTNKTLTIRNIVSPAKASEDPTQNGSVNVNGQPVVYFANSVYDSTATTTTITPYRLTIGDGTTGTVNLTGVSFSGQSFGGQDGVTVADYNSRTNSGMYVQTSANLNISDYTVDDEVQTATTISKFYNVAADDANSGGFLYVSGTVTMSGGTISNCQGLIAGSDSNNFTGGGAVAYVATGGTFNFSGGTITENGIYQGPKYTNCAISCQGGSFYMTGGKAINNKGSHGGFLGVYAAGSKAEISGGEISGNRALYDGGAVFVAWFGNECIVSGNALIRGNYANRSAGAIALRQSDSYGTSSCTIKGNAHIVGNTCGGSGSNSNAAVAPLAGTASVAVSGNPVVYDNTNSAGAQCNISVNGAAYLQVGTMERGALVGIYNTSADINAATKQFGTSTAASASSSGYLYGFVNDVTKDATTQLALRGEAGTDTAVVWGTTASNVKVTEMVTAADGTTSDVVHTFATLADAFACVNLISADNMPTYDADKYFKVEVLVEELSQTAQCSYGLGSAKPIMITTAATDATDGYKYRGTAGTNATLKRAFGNTTMLNVTGGSVVTIKNLTIDGAKATYTVNNTEGVLKIQNASKVTLDTGAVLQNSKTSGEGGAVRIQSQSTIVMQGNSKITGCIGQGGALCGFVANLEMKDTASITDCHATEAGKIKGGAVILWNGTFSMSGEASITDCTAGQGSALTLGVTGGQAEGFTNTRVYLSDKANISANSCNAEDTASDLATAISITKGADVQTIVSGTPTVYGNTNSAGNQANIVDWSDENVGSQIQVAEAGLGADANLGVYSANNDAAGDTFALTETSPSTDYANLASFKNDKNSHLTGFASTENRVVWSSAEPLTITKTIPAAVTDDTWFTVQLVNNTTGDIYRQSIKVEAGQTSGSATLVLQSGFGYTVTDVSAQSNWRYANSAATYAGYADSEWSADATGASIGTVTLDGYSANRTLTLTTAKTSDLYASENTSVVNTITVPEN